MRRHLHALLTAWLLASGAAPLAAIEYHAEGDLLADPVADSAGDPLAELQSQAETGAIADDEPGMIEGFCDSCCDCCGDWCGFDGIYRPRSWIARADVMWIERSQPQDDVIVSGDGGVVFNAVELGPDEFSGYDLSIMELDPHGNGTEFRYMQLGEFSRTVDLDLTNPVIGTTPPTPLFFVPGLNDVDVKLESVLRSYELHKLWARDYGTWMFGVRYLELDEDLNIDTLDLVGPAVRTNTNFRAQNDAVGLQLGYGTMLYEHNCWRLQYTGKTGIYYREFDSQVQFTSGGQNLGQESDEGSAAAAEARLVLIYQFSPGWAWRMGVEGFFLDGVGLATEQVETTEDVILNNPIDTDINLGTVYWYGAFIGLEYNF